MATLSELAEICGGKIAERDKDYQIHSIATLTSADEQSLAPFYDQRYAEQLTTTKAGVVIADSRPTAYQGRLLEVKNPQLALTKLMPLLYPVKECAAKVEASAQIASDVSLPEEAYIGHNVVIASGVIFKGKVYIGSGAYIGENVIIDAGASIGVNCSIMHGCSIGENCHISAGVVIGADGFGYVSDANQNATETIWRKTQHIGKVIIGKNVEIGANTTIDRGSIGDTIIGDNVIIDNLVQIAHNVNIGRGTAIAGCAAIAGSTTVGADCLIAGRAALVGHLIICDKVTILANSLVTKSIATAGVYSSSLPAQPVKVWRKLIARLRKLS